MGVLEIFHSFPADFCQCPADIISLSWKYLMGVLEIFHRCLGNI